MTFVAIYELLKKVWSNKNLRYLICSVLLILLLVFSWIKVTGAYYNKGIAYQTSVYNEEQKRLKEQFEKDLLQANKDRSSLNAELQEQKSSYAKLLLSRQEQATVTTNEVIKYVQSDNGSKHSLDSEWVRIYENSLPQ